MEDGWKIQRTRSLKVKLCELKPNIGKNSAVCLALSYWGYCKQKLLRIFTMSNVLNLCTIHFAGYKNKLEALATQRFIDKLINIGI